MKLEFAKYERSESTLESLGTVLEQVGKDGKLSLIPKNLKSGKRVVVVLTKKDGKSAMVTCSQQVSDGIRNKTITLGNVLGFEMLYDETTEVPFISLPGGGMIEFAVRDLTATEYEPSAVAHEDLIAL